MMFFVLGIAPLITPSSNEDIKDNMESESKNCITEIDTLGIVLAYTDMNDMRNDMSKLNIYLYILELDIKFPEIVYAQVLHETGNLRSQICRYGNNLFGMKYPRKRKTTAIGYYNKHARYRHWKDSVRDYKHWQDYYIRDNDVDNYYTFLRSKGYATDRWYVNKLKTIVKQNKNL